jgi:histidinol-phosphate/aromatic aminotransferase/cobyric acid decarboxylase-like protein
LARVRPAGERERGEIGRRPTLEQPRAGCTGAFPVTVYRQRIGPQEAPNVIDEKDRFYSRLATIPGISPMPSIGDWILLRVAQPTEVARRVARRLIPGLVSVPRHIDGAVRVTVSDPKTNERLLRALREAVS